MSVIIETSIGDITLDLYTDERPRCSQNFLKLCKVKYYNFSLFHSVQENLVAQVGDPTATGRGGESIFGQLYGEQARFFDMEVTPRIKHTKKGLVSMVNNGSGMHGSQFFVTLADNLDYLDGKHTVFAEVAEGFDIIDKLNKTYCDEQFRPHQDIRIYHTIVLDDPYPDPDGLTIPAQSPGPTLEMKESDRIPCDADVNVDNGKTEEEIAEMDAEKEAKANTQILEMVGDLPDAHVAPPENVLFVCKLNPVTTSDDLEIIFSRFGTIVSCEVIKDQKTGESLQYAFIEFSCEKECENAYFKMDNVLIDDRRIHVDFSQSVSKVKWKGKGKGVEIVTGGAANLYLKNQQRQDDHYDLVYEHDDSGPPGQDRSESSRHQGGKPRKSSSQKNADGNNARNKRKQSRSSSRERKRKRSIDCSDRNTESDGEDDRRRNYRQDKHVNRQDNMRYDRRDRHDDRHNSRHDNGQYGRRDGRQHDSRNNRLENDQRRRDKDRSISMPKKEEDRLNRGKKIDEGRYERNEYSIRRREDERRRNDRKEYRSRSRSPVKDKYRTKISDSDNSDADRHEHYRSRKRMESKKVKEDFNEDSRSSRGNEYRNERPKIRQRHDDSDSSEFDSDGRLSKEKKKKKKKKKIKDSSSDNNDTGRKKSLHDDSSDEHAERHVRKKKKKKHHNKKNFSSSDDSDYDREIQKKTKKSRSPSASSDDSLRRKRKKKKDRTKRR